MGYMEKWPSRMQGQICFWSWMEQAIVFGRELYFYFYFILLIYFCGGCVEMMDCGSWPLTTSSLKFVGGGLASAQGDLD